MTTEMEDAHMEESENSRDLEVAPALIAVHPSQKSVTVAVGSDLRVYDLQYAPNLILNEFERHLLLVLGSLKKFEMENAI